MRSHTSPCLSALASRRFARFQLGMRGAIAHVTVRSPRAHALSRHMKPIEAADTSRYLLAPMPGQIISVAAAVGDAVEAGQELAVIEAMKMQNVLRAPRSGVVKEQLRGPGDAVQVDEVIMEFE